MYYFYKLFPDEDKVGKLEGTYDSSLDLESFIYLYKKEMLHYKEPFCNFELNTTYFFLNENDKIVGVINLGKGYTFIDHAEYNERIYIHDIFPNIDCGIPFL